MIQYIKINNTNQIQINDAGKQVYYSLLWFWKGRKTEISYGEITGNQMFLIQGVYSGCEHYKI